MRFFNPKTMYKINIGGIIANLIFTLFFWALGLDFIFIRTFLFAALYFFLGAAINLVILKIQNKE